MRTKKLNSINHFSINHKILKWKHKKQISWILSALLACASYIQQTELMIFILLSVAFLAFLGNYKWLMFSCLVCTIAICEQFQTQYKNQQKSVSTIKKSESGQELQNIRAATADKSHR